MFEKINFKNGEVKYLSGGWLKEDMLQVVYPEGYILDVGYYKNVGFIVYLIRDGDWSNPVKRYVSESTEEMLECVRQIIEEVGDCFS